MKRHKNFIYRRVLSLLMVLVMLVPFFGTVLPIFSFADEPQNEEPTLPTVSISWASGTQMSSDGKVAMPVKSAGDSASSYKLTYTVKASGTITAPITLRVQSFEISAIADVEYTSVDEEFVLKPDAPQASGTVTVMVDTGYVTKVSATEIYTAEFGLAITEVTNAQKMAGGDTIRSQVLPPSKRLLEVMKNKDAASKNYGDGLGDFKEGYVYSQQVAANGSQQFKETVAVEKSTSSNSVYPQEFSPYATLKSLAPTLFKAFNMRVYLNGRVNVTDDASLERGGFNFELRGHDGKYDPYHDSQVKPALVKMDEGGKKWDNHKFYFSDKFTSNATTAGVAHRVNDYGANFAEVEEGEYVSIYAYNKATGLASGRKYFTIDFEFLAADPDALVVWDYSLSNTVYSKTGNQSYTSRVYAGGDTLYLSLRFNKPVQFTHDGKEALKIQAEINGDNAYYFTYCGGDKTDTLIFSLTLPTDREVQGDEIKLVGFSNEGTKRIDDMLWNRGNRNNSWAIADSAIKDKTISCAVDTRKPSITIYDQSKYEHASKTASFKIELKKITERGSLFVEWTHSPTPPEAKSEWSNLVSFSIGSEGYATVPVDKTALTGLYYAHVKAVSEAGVESVASCGPFYFDNTAPVIKNTRLSTGDSTQRYADSHKLLFDITDGNEAGGVSGIDEVYMKVQREDGSNGLRDGVDKLTVYQSSKTSNRLTIDNGEASINVDALTMLDIGENSYGAYRIAFYALDKVKNESTPVWHTESLMFDTRKSFEAYFVGNPDYSFEGRVIYKNGQSLVVKHEEEGDLTLELEFLRYNGVDVKDKLSANGFSGSVNNAATEYTLTMQASVQGYIELGLLLNGEKHAVLGFYATDDTSSAVSTNYEKLYAADRLLINEVWQLSTALYYSGNNRSGSYYVGDNTKPIFSSREKALEYVKFFEKQDIVIEHIDDAEEKNNLERGVLAGYRRAEADKDIAVKIGQTWLRYKSISWTPGSSNEENWVYYFYSDETESTVLPNLTSSLNAAIERNAKLICNYDGDNRIYLTLNNNTVTKDGEPSYKRQGVLKTQLSHTGIYSTKITCSADNAIYDSFVSMGGEQLPIIGGYRFEINAAQKGFVYYRQYNKNGPDAEWRPFANGESFRNKISSSGIYEVCEFGNGYKTYRVYVDLDAPVIAYELTVGEGTPQAGYVTAATTGATLRASEFTVKKLVNSVTGTLSVEADRCAYFYVLYSSIGGKEYTFMTMNELNRRGCTLETGVYKIYACDRFGNTMSQTVKINSEDVVITPKETSKGLTVTCNRTSAEIVTGTFKVERDGTPMDGVTYSQSMTFPKSGEYTISFEDVYGNVVNEEFSFERPLPTVVFSREIQEGAGRYEQITVNSAASNDLSTVVSENNREFMVSTSANIRISYSLSSGYVYEFVGTEPEFKATVLSSMQHVVIQSTSKRWTMLVYHEEDPEKAITITCNVDKDAPLITGTVFAPEYSYNDQNGAKDNVLFTPTGKTSDSEFNNGARAVGERVKIKWEDETGVSSVGYTLNGGKRVTLNAALAEWEPTEYGTYVVDATDLFGNKATFEFIYTDHIDFEVLFGDEVQTLDENPKNHISGNRYDHTLYTSREMQFVLKEDAMMSFYYTNGAKQFIYTLGFEAKKDEALLWVGVYGDTPDDVEDLQNIDLTHDVSGTLFEGDFTVKYSYENGVLTLTVPKCEKEYELWQFRITDFTGHSPAIVQVERSSRTSTFDLFKEDGEKLEISSEGFVGSNQKISLDNSSISEDTTEIVAYYSKTYTTDFKDVEAVVLYGKGAVGLLSEEGYYKIVATNKYGNEKVVYVVVTFSLMLDVHVSYSELDTRTETLNVPGAYSVFTNSSVEIVVWDTNASILCQKDDKASTVTVTENNGYLSFTLSEVGEYTVTVKDGCGNDYTVTVTVKEPETLTYNAFLAGFNENALKKDENYTNGALNLDKTKVEESGIHYIAFRKVGDEEWTVLYDLLSLDKIEDDKSVFEGTIGKEDGEYEVIFADKYGNVHTETVKVSRKPMLSIERQTQSSTKSSEYDFEFALENGAWSNYILTFINSSEKYLLKVDGEEVSFKNGRYTFTLPTNLGSAEKYYVLEYVDDYGNSYKIKVNLYRYTPETSVADGADTVTVDDLLYAKSDFSLVWGDYINATYSLNGDSAILFDQSTVFTEDGKYTLVFIDYAGNEYTRIIVKDSQVLYDMSNDGFIIYNGAVVSSKVTLSPDEDLTFTVTKNGEEYTEEGRTFTEDGHYVVTLTDRIGNVSKFEFTIYAKAKQSFTFVVPEGYSFSQIWFVADGTKTSLVTNVVLNEDGSQSYEFSADGRYEIELLHTASNQICYFTLNIDNIPPEALLVGAENGGVTRNNVTLEGLKSGDMIYVYKNGELISTYIVDGNSETVLELLGNGDFGDFLIHIEDEAGNSVTYEFTKEFATNTYSNIFICLLLMLFGAIGIIYIRFNGKIRTK